MKISEMTDREMDIWLDGRDTGLRAAMELLIGNLQNLIELTAHDKENLKSRD